VLGRSIGDQRPLVAPLRWAGDTVVRCEHRRAGTNGRVSAPRRPAWDAFKMVCGTPPSLTPGPALDQSKTAQGADAVEEDSNLPPRQALRQSVSTTAHLEVAGRHEAASLDSNARPLLTCALTRFQSQRVTTSHEMHRNWPRKRSIRCLSGDGMEEVVSSSLIASTSV
jgi:hypothetical protein